jgi:hypothetical protein
VSQTRSRIDTASTAGSRIRIGLGIIAVVIFVAGINGEAFSKSGKRHRQARHFVIQSLCKESAKWLQPAPQQPIRLGPMRYYGGPKSPMWRAPVEN